MLKTLQWAKKRKINDYFSTRTLPELENSGQVNSGNSNSETQNSEVQNSENPDSDSITFAQAGPSTLSTEINSVNNLPNENPPSQQLSSLSQKKSSTDFASNEPKN